MATNRNLDFLNNCGRFYSLQTISRRAFYSINLLESNNVARIPECQVV